MPTSLATISIQQKHWVFYGFMALTIGSILLGVAIDFLPLAGLSIGLLYVYQCINRPFSILVLFFFLLPFSTEIELAGGVGTDLPSEPIMLSLLGIFMLFLLKDIKKFKAGIFNNPIAAILLLHLVWIGFTAIFSTDNLISVKFLLAKTWYVVPFYFLPLLLIKDSDDFRKIFKFLTIAMLIAISYVMLRHAQRSFSFDMINKSVRPIFRNHVNYAAMIALCMPYFWSLFKSEKGLLKGIMIPIIAFFLVASYFSYTRAAFVSIFMAVGVFYIIRWKLLVPAILVSLGIVAAILGFMVQENNYLEFAPDFEKTVAHDNFENIVEATYKMEDISTMERLYRWVAGVNMVTEKPWLGYGPGCFYTQYKSHTVEKFKTYVSDNPEKSGVHNYYLMIFIEQGVFGFLIFLLLTVIPLIVGSQVYRSLTNPADKALIMAAMLSLIIIDAVIIINDLIEADKAGPFYFLNLSIISWFYLRKPTQELES